MYKNHERYSDPTAGAAIANVMAEYYRKNPKKPRKPGSRSRERQRENRRKKHARMKYAGSFPATQNPKEADKNDR